MLVQQQFNKTLSAAIKKGDKLALAVSGGMDSMCMLLLCVEFCKNSSNKLIVISVEHGIRGKNSKRDLQFVENFCIENSIDFSPFIINVPKIAKEQKLSIETAARNARREIFQNLILQGVCDRVLLAHHASDNVESILMHIFRGSGLNGLIGMQVVTDDFIVRPLLNITREQIEKYVKLNNIPYITDETNSDIKYARNFIRQEIIPKLRQDYCPNLEKAILQLSKESQNILNVIKLDESKIIIDNKIIKIELSALESSFADRYVLLALEKIKAKINIERIHIDQIIMLKDKQNGATIDLPNNLIAAKEYDHVIISKKQKKNREECVVKYSSLRAKKSSSELIKFDDKVLKVEQSSLSMLGIISEKKEELIENSRKLYFDVNKIPPNAIFRYRKDGDIFKPFGNRAKSVSNYLIDKKIPLRLRNNLICLCIENRILIIVGIEISDDIKVCDNTKNIYTIKIEDNL